MRRKLVREPIKPHKWRFHKWQDVDAVIDWFGLARQCAKCNAVEVHDLLTDEWHYGSHKMLKGGEQWGDQVRHASSGH